VSAIADLAGSAPLQGAEPAVEVVQGSIGGKGWNVAKQKRYPNNGEVKEW
jgi:hypothetical protein